MKQEMKQEMKEEMAEQEMLAAKTLNLFMDIWCISKNENKWFNCERCNFQNEDGTCAVKKFINSRKKEEPKVGYMTSTGDEWNE